MSKGLWTYFPQSLIKVVISLPKHVLETVDIFPSNSAKSCHGNSGQIVPLPFPRPSSSNCVICHPSFPTSCLSLASHLFSTSHTHYCHLSNATHCFVHCPVLKCSALYLSAVEDAVPMASCLPPLQSLLPFPALFIRWNNQPLCRGGGTVVIYVIIICCLAPLHCTALHYTALHCTALHCTALHCTALHCTALHCTTLHCTALHCTALHCTAIYYSSIHCNTF